MTRLKEILSHLSNLDLNISETPQTFTLFPKLPLELRNKIWDHAAMGEPRTIKLHVLAFKSSPKQVKISTSVPSILRTCSESRAEGSRYYDRLLERDMLPEDFVGHHKNVVYVNFATDTFVYMPISDDLGFFSPEDRAREPWQFNFELEDLNCIQRLSLCFSSISNGRPCFRQLQNFAFGWRQRVPTDCS